MRAVFLALALCVSQAAWASDLVTYPIQFIHGTQKATVEGRIVGQNDVDYTVRARAGQMAKISLSGQNAGLAFNLMAPGETNVAFYNGAVSGNRFEGALPKDGVYRIRVYLTKGAVSNNEVARYRLDVKIGTASAKPAASHRPH